MSDATPSDPVGKVGGMRSWDIDGDPATYQVEVPAAAAAARRGPLYSTNLVCKAAGAQYYQWFKDGVLIPGATTDTYTVTWERAAPPEHVINYSVRPVYSVFNETVYGEEDTTSITNLPAGFTTAFK